MRNYFPKQPSCAPIHTLSKVYDVPVGFVPPLLRLRIALFAVVEGWLLLDTGWFVLFLHFYARLRRSKSKVLTETSNSFKDIFITLIIK